MKGLFLSLLILFSLSQCNSPEDVEPDSRNTFVKFFGSSLFDTGSEVEETEDGYILLANALTDSLEYTILTKIDAFGNTQWESSYVATNGNDLIVLEDGYLIVGDSIKELDATESSTSIYLLKVNMLGELISSRTLGSDSDAQLDHHGVTATSDSDGNVLVIGTRENESDLEETVLAGYNSNLELLWDQQYKLNDRNYEVGSSIHNSSNNSFIWASSSTGLSDDDDTDISDAYITVQVVSSDSENINNASYGQNNTNNYFASDIQPGAGSYGIVGSTDENGNSDMLFIRCNSTGNIDPSSAKIFSSTMNEIPLSGNDEGLSLVATHDGGFVLMGAITTTTQVGNGGKDIYLIKINALGNPVWESIIGGNGNEIGHSIKQTKDGGFVIIGSFELQGTSMTMLIKTNPQGKLIE